MFEKIVEITDFLWGTPMIILILAVGFYLSIRTGFFQILGIGTTFKKTFGEMFKKDKALHDEGSLPPFQVLSTVLAGTVGSGNIAGVAAAIAIGGPGAVFWMWIVAIFGMLTKMAEVSLAVRYREKGADGEFYGGPMYYIRNGLGKNWSWLAVLYSIGLFVIVIADACFVQVNTLATAAQNAYGTPLLITGIVVVVTSLLVIIGGTKRIGDFCGKMVPPMCLLWIIACLAVIIINIGSLGESFLMIFKYAFAPMPAVGGFTGSTIALAMARGASRGIFSNEAGEGTAATVHATAKTDHPIHQGMYGIVEVFIDTIIICSLTALAIISSGVWSNGETGIHLSFSAFRTVFGEVGIWIAGAAVILFCYSSYLGFFVEFRTSLQHLFGEKIGKYLRWLFFIPPLFAVTMEIEAVWSLADIAVGIVFIPNMVALIALSPKFIALFKEYSAKLKIEKGK
jgi:AGCS family alanine or glycine:cation symporter